MTELMNIATDYAVAIQAAFNSKKPWAEGDQFWGNVASLLGELSVESGVVVQMVALDLDWKATCFKSDMRWFDLTGQAVNEREVAGMVIGGAWLVLTDGTEWCGPLPSVH